MPSPLPALARAALALATAGLCAAPALAQEWPKARPIRIVVPNPPAGPSDISLRPVAAAMQAALGQAVVVDNKPGANGNIGAAEVARSAPDGYTWLWAMDPVLTVNPHIYKNMGYKADALETLVVAARFSQTLVCGPGTGFKSVKDMVAASKTRELTYASGGAGSPGHLVMDRCWPPRARRWSTCPTRARRRPCRTCWAARWTADSWLVPRSSPRCRAAS